MILQDKKILCDVEEPDKNHIWMRPRLDREGYDLLYFGSKGWMPLIDCENCLFKKNHMKPPVDEPVVKDDVLVEIPDKSIEGIEGNLYEITQPSLSIPTPTKPSLGCPK